MKNLDSLKRWRPGLVLALLGLLAVLCAAPAGATDKYWVGGNGDWNLTNNWSPPGQPQDGDNVYLTQTGTTDLLVNYYNSLYPSAVLGGLTIDGTGGGNITLSQSNSAYQTLASLYEYVGDAGTGAHVQSGGTNTVSGTLTLAGGSGSSGTYGLSGTGSLSAQNETIAYGAGQFTQSGGTNAISGELSLGKEYDSGGSYNLSGSGSLSAQVEIISDKGAGQFTQSGGTNKVSNILELGVKYDSGVSGSYALSDGSLLAATETVGAGSSGAITQSGGSNTVSGALTLGGDTGSYGSYALSDGSLAAHDEIIGFSGSGSFTQNGGSNTVIDKIIIAANGGSGGYLLQDGSLSAADIVVNAGGNFTQTGGTESGTLENYGAFTYGGGTFNGRLLAYVAPTFNADFTAGDGMANYTDITIPSGRIITLNGQGLDNSGTLSLAGGVLTGNGPLVNNAYLAGYGTIGGSGGFINNGFFTQNGGSLALNNTGANYNYGNLDLAGGLLFTLGSGATLNNQGTLNLNGAVINGAGSLSNGYGGTIAGKGTIVSSFANAGGVLAVGAGTTNITQPFSNSGLVQLTDFTANLAGGAMTNTGTIQGLGQVGNAVTNTGTIEAIGGTLTLGGTVANNAGGLLTAGTGGKLLIAAGLNTNAGVINLTGGTFDNNNHPLSNTSEMSGYGTFRTGGLSNSGTMTLSGGTMTLSHGTTTVQGDVNNQASGKITVAYNPAIFTGNVVNSGTVKTTSTTVTWAGSFTNSGAYISDPATNYFTDLIVGPSGYLVGGAGDQFIISNDFINQSTQNLLWKTLGAVVQFTTGTDSLHNLYLPGQDLGPSWAGYTDNFAWGTLDLTGQSLNLVDGNATAGGALYVGKILGLTLTGLEVSDIIGNGFNIYYDPGLNPDLNGLTYDLQAGGCLEPTPVPPSLWLFLSGLAGLGLLERGRMSRKS
jgi:hypothetical protein